MAVSCVFGPVRKIKLATRASDAFVFRHNTRKMGDIRNLSRKDMSSYQFPLMDTPLNPSAPGPFRIPANLPAHSNRLQPLPSLSIPSCLLLTNSQPLLPHFPLFLLPFLHFPPSYSISTPFRTQPSSAILPASKAPISLPRAAPAVRARVLRAARSHASPYSFPSQRRPSSPPPDRSRPSLPHF